MLQGRRLGVPLLVAIVYAAYAAVPGRVWTAWPLFLILVAPGLLSVAVAIVFRRVEQRSCLDSSYRDRPAGGWLIDRLGQEPALGVSLVGLSDDDKRNCYHSDSRTIVLADGVHHGNTLGNYATAAHELGHALMHARSPRLFRFTLWCRGKGERCFFWGWLVLVAMVATGTTSALPVAELCFAVAVAATTTVAVDEAIASKIAMRELRLAGFAARRRWIARFHLLCAFASYTTHAVAAGAVLMMWPQLEAWIGAGSFTPGNPPNDRVEQLSMFAAAGVLVSSAGALWMTIRAAGEPQHRSPLPMAAVCVVCTMALFLIVFDQPIAAAAPWAVMMAALPAFELLTAPFAIGLTKILQITAFLFGPPERAALRRVGPPVRSIPLEALIRKGQRPPRDSALEVLAYCALSAPLAYLYLDPLFGR